MRRSRVWPTCLATAVVLASCAQRGRDARTPEGLGRAEARVSQAGIDALVQQWSSLDPEVRESASRAVVARYREWGPADLDTLTRAGSSPDPEVAALARAATIEIRRRPLEEVLGVEVTKRLPTLYGKDGKARLAALQDIERLWLRGEVPARELRAVAELAIDEGWQHTAGEWIDLAWGARLTVCPAYGSFAVPLLRDRDADVRKRALGILRYSGSDGRRYVKEIAELLEDTDADVRHGAIIALCTLGAEEYACEITAVLKSEIRHLREAAIHGLELLGPRHSETILPLLKDPDAQIRWAAAAALGGMGARRYADSLVPLLTDDAPLVRMRAAFSLAEIGSTAHGRWLLPLTRDPDTHVRRASLVALGALQSKEHATEVVRLLQDPSSVIRAAAAFALGQMAAKEHADEISALLKDAAPSARCAATGALADMEAARFVSVVRARLDDQGSGYLADQQMRESILALVVLGGSEEAAAIVPLLAHRSDLVRRSAAQVLCVVDAKQHAAAVAKSIGEDDIGNLASLVRMDPHKYIPIMRRFLRHPSSAYRGYTALVVGDVGSRSLSAQERRGLVEELRAAQSDKIALVRLRASIGLLHLGALAADEHRILLDEITSGEWSGTEDLWDDVLDALMQVHDKEADAKLEACFERPVLVGTACTGSLVAWLEKSGLPLDRERARLRSKLPDALATTPRDALRQTLHEDLWYIVENRTIRIVDWNTAVEWWRRRLPKP